MVKPSSSPAANFIGTTAAAGAGLLLTSCSRKQSSDRQKIRRAAINIALIGFGAEGAVLLDSLLRTLTASRSSRSVISGPTRRNEGQRYLKANGIEVRAYENYEDLLAKEKDLQAVVVATPDFWHAPITNACLKAGLHVYCEKMMSNTIEGARSMVQTMRETGKLLQIGHQRRSNPRYLFALNRLLRRREILRPPDGRAGAVEPRGGGGFWLAEKFGHDARDNWPNMATRTCTSSGTGAGSRGWAAGRCPTSARIRLTFSTGGSACTPNSVMASGGVDYYTNHEWYDNAMVIYEYPLALGRGPRLLSGANHDERRRRLLRDVHGRRRHD